MRACGLPIKVLQTLIRVWWLIALKVLTRPWLGVPCLCQESDITRTWQCTNFKAAGLARELRPEVRGTQILSEHCSEVASEQQRLAERVCTCNRRISAPMTKPPNNEKGLPKTLNAFGGIASLSSTPAVFLTSSKNLSKARVLRGANAMPWPLLQTEDPHPLLCFHAQHPRSLVSCLLTRNPSGRFQRIHSWRPGQEREREREQEEINGTDQTLEKQQYRCSQNDYRMSSFRARNLHL